MLKNIIGKILGIIGWCLLFNISMGITATINKVMVHSLHLRFTLHKAVMYS